MSVQHLPVSAPASLCPFCCSTKGENNEGGHCSVWPDNVKVFKGGNEGVSVLTWEGGPRSTPALSVHSNPCPAAQHSDRAAVTACRPMADLHRPSVPKQADVSLCQPPWSGRCWDSSKLHKVTVGSVDEVEIINKDPTGPSCNSQEDRRKVSTGTTFHIVGTVVTFITLQIGLAS